MPENIPAQDQQPKLLSIEHTIASLDADSLAVLLRGVNAYEQQKQQQKTPKPTLPQPPSPIDQTLQRQARIQKLSRRGFLAFAGSATLGVLTKAAFGGSEVQQVTPHMTPEPTPTPLPEPTPTKQPPSPTPEPSPTATKTPEREKTPEIPTQQRLGVRITEATMVAEAKKLGIGTIRVAGNATQVKYDGSLADADLEAVLTAADKQNMATLAVFNPNNLPPFDYPGLFVPKTLTEFKQQEIFIRQEIRARLKALVAHPSVKQIEIGNEMFDSKHMWVSGDPTHYAYFYRLAEEELRVHFGFKPEQIIIGAIANPSDVPHHFQQLTQALKKEGVDLRGKMMAFHGYRSADIKAGIDQIESVGAIPIGTEVGTDIRPVNAPQQLQQLLAAALNRSAQVFAHEFTSAVWPDFTGGYYSLTPQSPFAEKLETLAKEIIKNMHPEDKRLQTVYEDAITAAKKLQQRMHIPAALSLAFFFHESNEGKAIPGNNPFGIKGEGPAGSQLLDTTEEIQGKLVPTKDKFRKYHNLTEAFADFGNLLTNGSAFIKVREALYQGEQNAVRLASLIHESGYATDSSYVPKIVKHMIKRNLWQYNIP